MSYDYYLPDTAITSMAVDGKAVYAYVQIMSGALVECEGSLDGNPELYIFEQHNHVMARFRDKKPLDDAPKLFTPLAAAYLGDARYLFYVDDNNYLRDRYISPQARNKWVAGRLFSDRGIKVAQYSKLAAITVPNRWGTSICVYYQILGEDAAIESVNFKEGQSRREVDTRRVTDPPPYGTSLTAVLARDGIQLNKAVPFDPNSSLPVVYLQWHSLELAHAQGKGTVRRMEDLKLRFAPHTSLSVVDDISGLQYFYTSSDDNYVRRVIIKNNGQMEFDTLATPTPRSALAAVRVKPGKVVLFYQALEKETSEKVLLFGLTLSHSGGAWDGKPGRPAPPAKELR
ncbi:hypothetical protein K469DRAFT_596531 [Zopfia rhizophila CBS 207.26]|uniref:Fucose-specific lectin n=1 Tax=Zopfia rhizophila CBS 207.26 TaxID=1314779 RepID=A0A6A6DK50_9PEZI|nr:hypothetical protein K469DRAFT_596531 [Zopfia rhizophila CBS 207.26]